MCAGHSHDEFDFFSLLLVLLTIAFLVLLALDEILAAIVIGIAILVLLVVNAIS